MKNILILTVFIFAFANCTAQRDTKPNEQKPVEMSVVESDVALEVTPLIHTVYFWLTDDLPIRRKKEFEQALEDLSKVPSIDKFYWGVPAKTADRDVTEKSYDYAINVFFKSVADEAAYQIDPLHLKFVEENKAIFKEVIVYDNTFR